jgi:PST family polysaccharide transporter
VSLLRALKWSFLSEFAAKAIQPIIFIIVARLLTPEDFGVLSAALMVISFAQLFWDAGVGKALIQRQIDEEKSANAAFWINLGMGVVVAGILLVTAGPIARTFFHDERVTVVLQVMTLQVLLGAVSAVHVSLLQKDFGFQKLFWVRFATVSLPGLASIPLAWAGFSYWALVAGSLVGQLAQTVLLWRMSSWRPKWTFDRVVALDLGRFGAWVGLAGLLSWFYTWADALIVGMYLGSHDLGLYRTGSQFAMMAFFILFGPIKPVLYSLLSRLNADRDRVRRAVPIIFKLLIVSAVPLAVTTYMLSEPLGAALFGPKWTGIGLVIGVMALMQGFSWVVGMNSEMYRAAGKPAYDTIVTASLLLVYLAAYIFSIRQGFTVFLWVRLALALGAIVPHFLVVRSLMKLPFLPIVKYFAFVTAWSVAANLAVWYALHDAVAGPWLKLVFEGGLIAIVLAGIVYLTERNGAIKDVRNILKAQLP